MDLLPYLYGRVLTNMLQTDGFKSGLLGAIVIDMLDEALLMAPSNAGDSDQLVQFRFLNTFRLLFDALDHIGSNVMEDFRDDFVTMSTNMFRPGSPEQRTAVALKEVFFTAVGPEGKLYRLRPVGLWNELRFSSPTVTAVLDQAHGSYRKMFRVGSIAIYEDELIMFVSMANKFAREYYHPNGLVL